MPALQVPDEGGAEDRSLQSDPGMIACECPSCGYVTSVLVSPALQRTVALGYVRRECNQPGTELQLLTSAGPRPVRIVPLPFSFEPRGQPVKKL